MEKLFNCGIVLTVCKSGTVSCLNGNFKVKFLTALKAKRL